MVIAQIKQGPGLDSEHERERLARLAARQAEEAAAAASRKQQEELEAQRKAEEERIAEEKRKEEERIAEERKQAEIRAAEEKRKEEARVAEEKRQEEVRIAEQKRQEEARVAEEKRKAEAQAAEEKRKAEEARQAEERRKEEERQAEERRLAEKKRRDEEAAAEKARRLEEEKRKLAEALADMERINQLADPPILFDSFGEMGLRCISHREDRVIKPNPDGVKVLIGCINLENTRMLVKLEREDKSVVGEHAVMCTMAHNAAHGAHFIAEAIIPAAGKYSLKFFCNNEGGKTGYAHVATYDIEADAASTRSTQRFPKLHPAVPMALIEPLCDSFTAGQEVQFKVSLGPGVTAAQVATADGRRHMLKETGSGDQRIASANVKIASGTQNEGATSIICQKDGGEEWLVFTKFAVTA